MTDLILFVVQ